MNVLSWIAGSQVVSQNRIISSMNQRAKPLRVSECVKPHQSII